MGLFDLFFRKKEKAAASPTVATPSAGPYMPKVTPDKQLFACYSEVFKREFAYVTGISPGDVADIFAMVSAADGGHFNLSAYHSQVYEKYFKGRDWTWLEYERWNTQFTLLGRYPVAFQSRPKQRDTQDALSTLSVSDLKELLQAKGITFGAKARKQDLFNLANGVPGVADEPVVKLKLDEAVEHDRYALYTILMRTISFRAKGLQDYRRSQVLGVKKFKTLYTHPSDKEFVDLALRENPHAIPPYFPYDMTLVQAELDF